jgi:undecaprenyl-diphosphatase
MPMAVNRGSVVSNQAFAPLAADRRGTTASSTGAGPAAGSVFAAEPRALPVRVGRRLEHHRPASAAALTLFAGYLALAVMLVGLGAVVVDLVLDHGLGSWDDSVSRWLVEHRTAWIDHLTAAGTFIANTIPVIAVVLVVSVAFAVARRWREPLFLISALVLEFVVFLTANRLIDRDRPNVPRLDSTPATASYPSGHIAATIVVWGGLAIIVTAWTQRRALRLIAFLVAAALASLVGFARVYRGMHHLTDVVAGTLLGVGALAVALTAVRVTGYVNDRRRERRDDAGDSVWHQARPGTL